MKSLSNAFAKRVTGRCERSRDAALGWWVRALFSFLFLGVPLGTGLALGGDPGYRDVGADGRSALRERFGAARAEATGPQQRQLAPQTQRLPKTQLAIQTERAGLPLAELIPPVSWFHALPDSEWQALSAPAGLDYAHARQLLVMTGDQVRTGQVIVRLAAAGRFFAPQIHPVVHRHGRPVDPARYLKYALH